MPSLINWLRNADKFTIEGRGTVYTGPAPFAFDKSNADDMAAMMGRPWVISHPDAAGRLWRATGIDSFAIQKIGAGTAIGVVVEEWPTEHDTDGAAPGSFNAQAKQPTTEAP